MSPKEARRRPEDTLGRGGRRRGWRRPYGGLLDESPVEVLPQIFLHIFKQEVLRRTIRRRL